MTFAFDEAAPIPRRASPSKVAGTPRRRRPSGIPPAGGQDHAEENGGEQQAEDGGPGEGKGLRAEVGISVVGPEVPSAANVGGTRGGTRSAE